jgi:hypothetical protein
MVFADMCVFLRNNVEGIVMIEFLSKNIATFASLFLLVCLQHVLGFTSWEDCQSKYTLWLFSIAMGNGPFIEVYL